MAGGRDGHLEKKLDMALDELVDAKGHRRREGSRSPYRERDRRDSKGDGRFGGGRDFGKGKGKRPRIAPEDKALMHTRCSFNAEGDLVVRLYDTEVVVLKEKSASAEAKPAETADAERPEAEAPKAEVEDALKAEAGADDATKSEADDKTNGEDSAKRLKTDADDSREGEEVKKSDADGETKPDSVASEDKTADAKPAQSDEAKTTDSEVVKPVESSEAKPAGSDEAKPAVSDEAKPAGSDEAKPAGSDEAKAAGSDEAKPAGSDEAKPAVSDEAKPAGSDEAKPAGSDEAKPADADSAKPVESEEGKPAETEDKRADAQPAAIDVDAKAPVSQEGEKKPEAASGRVVILNSGTFRTIETRYVINEALYPLSLHVYEEKDSRQTWTVSGDAIDEEKSFKDRMELPLKREQAQASAVKLHLEAKIDRVKERDRLGQTRRRGDYAAVPPPAYGQPAWRPGMPPPHHWPPPPGWHGHPPPGWGGPPHHGAPHHYGPPPGAPRPPGYPGAPGGHGAPPTRPRGPLPDSMFQ